MDEEKQNQDAGKLLLGEPFDDPKRSTALTYAEVLTLLETKKNELEALDTIIPPIIEQNIVYCQQFSNGMKSEEVEEVRRSLEVRDTGKTRKLHSFEIASLINLAPYEDVENAQLLIPSLLEFEVPFLQQVIEEVNRLPKVEMD